MPQFRDSDMAKFGRGFNGNVGPAALKQAEGANAVMSCGYTGYMPTGKGRPVGMEIAGVVTKLNPDPVNIHISCMD